MSEDIDTRNITSPDVKMNKFPRKHFLRYKGSQKSTTMAKAYNLLYFDLIGLFQRNVKVNCKLLKVVPKSVVNYQKQYQVYIHREV
jgi:hypothetical protein